MIEWIPVTNENTLSVEILKQAYEYQKYLKLLLMQYVGRNAFLSEPDLSRNIRTIPFTELINKIESNLDTLFGIWQPTSRKASVEWFGELLDQRLLDYTDVNRWFEMMQLLEKIITFIPKRSPVTGTFRTGRNLTRQVIKRIYIWNYALDGSWKLGEKPFAEFK